MTTCDLAAPSDIEDIWRPLTDTEKFQVTNLITKASAKLRFVGRALNIDDRIALFATTPSDSDALDPVIVADAIAKIVKRALINPDDAVSRTRTVGPMSESTTFTGVSQQSEGGLEVRQSDLDALRPANSGPTIGSIRLKAGLSPHNITSRCW